MSSLQDGKWIIEYLDIGQLLFEEKGTKDELLLPYEKTIIFNGDARCGKSKLACAMGVEFCQRLQKQFTQEFVTIVECGFAPSETEQRGLRCSIRVPEAQSCQRRVGW